MEIEANGKMYSLDDVMDSAHAVLHTDEPPYVKGMANLIIILCEALAESHKAP